MSFGARSPRGASSSAEGAEAGSRVSSAVANGSAAAPVLRKVRRLNIKVPLALSVGQCNR